MIRWSLAERDPGLPAPLRDHAVGRAMIDAGVASRVLERLELADGRTLVAKHLSAQLDWMMRATGDTGRAAELWVSGAMNRLPAQIDPALVRIEDDGADGWFLYMDDVTFAPEGTRYSRADANRLLEALAALHAAFWEKHVPCLARLEDLIGLCAPGTIDASADASFADLVREGWHVFDDLAPNDVREAVHDVLADPSPLARELTRRGTTLVHSDPHFDNVVLAPDRVIMIDWTLASQTSPAVDFVWFLDQSVRFVDASHDELVADFLRHEAGRASERDVDLAALAELALAGWQCRFWVDGSNREERRANLDWFSERARRAL
jgi:tRNA A-37 threonylcarbamoyl transferase component Bud32